MAMAAACGIAFMTGLCVASVIQAADARTAFLTMIDRPRVPLAPEVQEMAGSEGLYQAHFTFAAEAKERVPGILMRRVQGGRLPVVIILHGTGGAKESYLPLLKDLAGRGFLAIAIDGRYHGERSAAGKGSAEYVDSMLRTYRTGVGHPFLYDTVWDVRRLLDYLETRDDVDPRRIGLIGFSKGGMETYLAAAVDPRITAVVPCIGVQSFAWALDHDSWHSRVGTFQAAVDSAAKDAGVAVDPAFLRHFYDKVAPGVYSTFDGPAMLPLIAPRPMLVINGDSDPRTPRPGLDECLQAGAKAYAAAGAQDKLEVLIQEKTGHQVKPDALQHAVLWFVKTLSPTL